MASSQWGCEASLGLNTRDRWIHVLNLGEEDGGGQRWLNRGPARVLLGGRDHGFLVALRGGQEGTRPREEG